VLRNHHYRSLYPTVRIGDIRDVGGGVVDDGGVIDVGDLRDVYRRVADVDAIHISFAHVIRRHVDFPRTEREPANISTETSGTAADEDDECGSVDGAYRYGTSHPSPAPANAYPAAVVEGSVTPGGIVNPGPSPRRDPIPVAFVVGSPSGVNTVGEPHVPVSAVIAPVAVVVEIVEADYVGGEIARGTGIIEAMVTGLSPTVELIGIADLFDISIERVGAAEVAELSAAQGVALAVAGGFAFAGAHADGCSGAVLTGFDAVVAGLKGCEGQVGCVDFEIVIVIQPTHGDVDYSGGELNLDGVVVEVKEGESGHGREADDGGAKLHFGA